MAGKRNAVKKAVKRNPGLLGRAARALGGRRRQIEKAVSGAQTRVVKKKKKRKT